MTLETAGRTGGWRSLTLGQRVALHFPSEQWSECMN